MLRSCLVSGRWNSLVAVLFAAMVSGTSYAFGIFSEILKDRLDFKQVDVALIGSFGSTGLYMGVFCGIAIEYTGPVLLLLSGGCFMFFGNFYMWLAVQRQVPHSLPVLCIVNYIAQLGVACSSSTVTTVGIRLFPTSVTGQVAGICKAYFGVSAAILATVASSYFHDESTNFILFVAISLPVCQVIGAFNVNFLPRRLVSFDYEIRNGYGYSLVPFVRHLSTVMILILTIGAITHWAVLHGKIKAIMGSFVLVVVFSVWLLPMLYGPRYLNKSDVDIERDLSVDDNSTYDRLIPDEQSSEVIVSNENSIDSDYERSKLLGRGSKSDGKAFVSFFGRHMPLREVMWEWRTHLVMAMFMFISGSGLLVINNVQAIAEAVSENPSGFFVTLLALANATGRVSVGLVSDAFARKLSRFQIQAIVCICMAAAQFILSFNNRIMLYPCLLLVGACFGATFSNIAALVTDLYGSKHVGANYGFVDIAPIAGSYAFATGLIAIFYPGDLSEGDDDADDDQAECEGPHCFRAIFLTTTVACLVASCFCFYLHSRTPINKLKHPSHDFDEAK